MKHKLLSAKEVKEGETIKIQIRHTPCGYGFFEKKVVIRINKEPKAVILTIKGETVD